MQPRHKAKYICEEAWAYIIVTVAGALIVQLLAGTLPALPFWLLVLFTLYVFRSSGRVIPAKPLAIVSPADARVTAIENISGPFLERDAIKMTLHIGILGEFTLRAPVEGKSQKQWHISGETMVGSKPFEPAVKTPETPVAAAKEVSAAGITDHYAIWIQTDEGDDLVMTVPLRKIARPSCNVNIGERIGQGHHCGFLPFGGEVNVLIPANARPNVEVGSKVRAGSDIIAMLVHT
jgi:phosphatidylserine decarboxylase